MTWVDLDACFDIPGVVFTVPLRKAVCIPGLKDIYANEKTFKKEWYDTLLELILKEKPCLRGGFISGVGVSSFKNCLEIMFHHADLPRYDMANRPESVHLYPNNE